MAPRNPDYAPEIRPLNEPLTEKRPPTKVVWRNVVIMGYLHLAALYGVFLAPSATPLTWLWTAAVYVMSALGITAGAHRLWSHRSYKAKLPFRIMLAIFNSMASQNDIIEWSRDHRVHHRHSETDADPHNAKRGFFFAHIGWLLVKKHPDVKAKGQLIDLSDLYADPVCVAQRRVYWPSVIFFCYFFPAIVPWYVWGESFITAFFVSSILRCVLLLNATWCVNSAAHMWGSKPYDKRINPAENLLVTMGAIGEGFHNYHHTFPYDYETSEFGWKMNVTSFVIDLGAALGQVYDRKKVSTTAVTNRMLRTGDGSMGLLKRPEISYLSKQQKTNAPDDEIRW